MKHSISLFTFLLFSIYAMGQSVGVNTPSPDPSAALEVSSTSQGMLIPRMTESQRDMISSPAAGLLIYQTDGTAGFYFHDGSAWTSLSGGGGGGSTGDGIMKVTQAVKDTMNSSPLGTLVYQTDEYKGIYAKESDGWRSQSGDTPITFVNVGTVTSLWSGTPLLLTAEHHTIYIHGEWNADFGVAPIDLPDPTTCKGRKYGFVTNNTFAQNVSGDLYREEYGNPAYFDFNGFDYVELDRDINDTFNPSYEIPARRTLILQSDGVKWYEIQADKTDYPQTY